MAGHTKLATKAAPRKNAKHTTKTAALSPRAVAVEKKRAEALELRLAGWIFSAIGEAIGVSEGRAYELVEEALASIVHPPLEKVREMELTRLDALLTTYFPQAIQGNSVGFGIVERIMAMRAKYLGLYAPLQVKATMQGSVEHSGQVDHSHTFKVEFVDAATGKEIEGLALPAPVNGKGNGHG